MHRIPTLHSFSSSPYPPSTVTSAGIGERRTCTRYPALSAREIDRHAAADVGPNSRHSNRGLRTPTGSRSALPCPSGKQAQNERHARLRSSSESQIVVLDAIYFDFNNYKNEKSVEKWRAKTVAQFRSCVYSPNDGVLTRYRMMQTRAHSGGCMNNC